MSEIRHFDTHAFVSRASVLSPTYCRQEQLLRRGEREVGTVSKRIAAAHVARSTDCDSCAGSWRKLAWSGTRPDDEFEFGFEAAIGFELLQASINLVPSTRFLFVAEIRHYRTVCPGGFLH
jgi:hypothetical protein